jgi:LysR family nod box-dependent transcriptional activator
MRLNRLDLNLLVALDALLTEKSITRAAERIHLSQPATSGALARLREFFGDELLVRVGAQMKPTPLGESLAAPVHNILLQIQTTVDQGLSFEPENSDRKFRIMCSDYTVSTIMDSLVLHLAKVAPSVQFDFLTPDNTPKEKLEKGEIDFLVMPSQFLSDVHPQKELFEEVFVCLADKDNPLLDEPITESEFLQAKHISVRFGSGRQRSQDQIFLEQHFGVMPDVEITTSTFNAIPSMLVNTSRITTCYNNLAKRWMDILPLKSCPIPFELPAVSWGLQWHKFRELDPGIQWMRRQITNIAKQKTE